MAAKRLFEVARTELFDTGIKLLTIYPGLVQTENKAGKMLFGISVDRAVDEILFAIRREKIEHSFPTSLSVYVIFKNC